MSDSGSIRQYKSSSNTGHWDIGPSPSLSIKHGRWPCGVKGHKYSIPGIKMQPVENAKMPTCVRERREWLLFPSTRQAVYYFLLLAFCIRKTKAIARNAFPNTPASIQAGRTLHHPPSIANSSRGTCRSTSLSFPLVHIITPASHDMS